MPGPGSRACPKGEKRSTLKRREQRHERAVKKDVRAQCVDRDGYCRVLISGASELLGTCYGPSQWAHLEKHRRSKTMGQDAEERHTTGGSCMFCWRHHLSDSHGYDRHQFSVEYLTDRGADGPVRYRKKNGDTFDEKQSVV